MSYTALYRKYRPAVFADVKGQDHVVTTLKNQIQAERIAHAYLFCGTRGTGKTSVAKIFARAVNCENPVDGEPCNECAACRAIRDGSALNVIEIDAASNNGVDNIRTIREEVAYPPTIGKYKVYIVDEVHMLSAGAFNALLKTLEEPPSYVIFILATTEAQKIPATILSRCQQYDFRRISRAQITDRLAELLQEEHIEADDAALRYIARKADGGMRDALSIADQCISFYLGETLTYEKVLAVLGAVDTQQLSAMYRHICRQDASAALNLLSDMVLSGRDIMRLTMDLITYMRNALLIQTTQQTADMLDLSEENFQELLEDAALVREETLMRYIRVLSDLTAQLRFAANQRVLLEIALIRMCRPQMEKDELSVLERLRRLERMLEEGKVMVASAGANMPAGYPVAAASSQTGTSAGNGVQQIPASDSHDRDGDVYEKAAPKDLQQIEATWKGIISGVSSPIFRGALDNSNRMFDPQDEQGNLLVISFRDFMGMRYAKDPASIQEIETLIAEKIGKSVRVKMLCKEDIPIQKTTYLNVRVIDEELKANIGFEVETDDAPQDPFM